MDLVQQPDITHTQGLKELVDLNLNDLNWSQSDDDEHPALVQTRRFLNTLVTLPELKALEPYALDSGDPGALGSGDSDASDSGDSGSLDSGDSDASDNGDSDAPDSGDSDADMKRSPEQLIGFMCKGLIPISLDIMEVYHPLILGSHSRYISYLQSFVTLITGSSGFLSLIRQLYEIRTAKFSLPQKRKLAQAGFDEHEPSTSETASICAEAHGRIQLLYFDLHHVLRVLLFEYQLICDIEFPVNNIQGLSENRMRPGILGKLLEFVTYHMYDVRHGCERINARDAEVQERQENERSQPTSPSLYRPLIVNHEKQEIRLLELQPGQTTDDIRCSLVETDLKTSGHFQALSYVWGTGKPSKTISINGNSFKVTLTLEKILRGLRYSVDRRRIWVDAICINQDDNFEKSAQVNLMGSIYQSAGGVIIWLSGGRIDGMAASITQCQKTVGCNEYDFASLADKMESILAESDISKKRWWNTVYHFNRCYYFVFIDEWWERLWTVREACLSSKPPIFLFRGYTFSWDTLDQAVRLKKEYSDTVVLRGRPRNQFPNAKFIHPMIKELANFPVTHRGGSGEKLAYKWRANPPSSKPGLEIPLVKATPRNSLKYLVFNCTRQHSKDRRDKIFALRGLLPKHLGLLLYSDYTEKFYETFHRVTGYTLYELPGMNLYSKFDTLHATNPSREVLENAPSWTLDFLSDLSSPWDQSEHQNGEEKTFASYLADGDIGYFPRPRDQFSGVATLLTLVCHGAKIGVVTANGEFPDIGHPTLKKGKMAIPTRHQLRRHKESLIQTVNELQPEEGTPQPEEVALWGMRERYPIHKAIFLGAGEYESSFEQGRPKWLAKTFLPRVRQLSKKYYFVTKSGFIGMGIAPFKEGDELFVLSDCRVPWVLRKFSNTNYRMVCRAWVGGMMEKELEPLFGNRTFHSRFIHII